MPAYIRDNLPEEMAGLADDTIYATCLMGYDLEWSKGVRECAEVHDQLVREMEEEHGRLINYWPGWAIENLVDAEKAYKLAREAQKGAMLWVREHRGKNHPASSSSSDAGSGSSSEEEGCEEASDVANEEAGEEADEEADDGQMVVMAVDESGEEAGEEHPQNNPAL